MDSTNQCFESITITHMINPHMFWFRPEISYCSNERYWALEDTLAEHFRKNKVMENNNLQFRVGEMVAVFMETWGKWIRVILDKNIKMLEGKTKCVLWAVDWGFPLQTDLERLRKLPFEYAAFETQDLYFAGLSGIVPSETNFNFDLLKIVEIQSRDWSELVVKEFRKLIEQASNIKFIPVIEKSEEHQTFGRLEITTHNGIIIDANDVLLQISGVMETENNKQFLVALQKCNSTKIKRCYNNYKRLSFSDLNYNKVTSEALDMEYKLDQDFFHSQTVLAMALPSRNIVDKVVDWDRRNYEANSVVGQSECESDIGTLVLEDDAFESISCYADQNLSITNQHCNRNYYDDEEDECFVKRCDLIRQNILHKYQGRMPRSATMSFDILQKEDNSDAFPFMKKILEKRLKLIELEKKTISTTSTRSNESDLVSTGTSQLSYLDKLQEKRARALKSIEEKNRANNGTIQHMGSVLQNPANFITAESDYDKKEQERREQLKQSIRGNDRNIGMYPIDYPVSQIKKDMESKKYEPSSKNRPQPPPSHYDQNKYQRQYSNNISPQERLIKYKKLNISSNMNGGFAENPSEVDSDVW